MNQLPELTHDERMVALEKAKAQREYVYSVKKAIKSGEMKFSQAVGDPKVQRTRVVRLIESCPGYGKVKSGRLMDEIGISRNRRVGGLGKNQMKSLVDVLG